MNRFYYLIFSCLFTVIAWAQPTDRQQKLEEQKALIQKEIAAFKTLLNDEKKKEKSVLNQIAEKQARIRLSEQLINTTAKQKRLLEDDIYITQLEINKLNRELEILKADYEKMIVKSYKSRNEQSRIMFVLSSQSFLQAYKRIQYMKQYSEFRKMQGDEIKTKQDKLGIAKTNLESNKKHKEKVLAESESEKKEMEKQKLEQEKLAKEVQKNQKKYASEITKKQREANEIDKQIKKLIAEAIAEANRKNAAKTGVKAPASSEKFVLTPEEKLLSNSFTANKGKLPWPVVKGYLLQKFGNYQDPVHRNVTHINSAIEIATESGSNARAIYDGEVLGVQVIRGTNRKIVHIQHGDFISIYQNLETVTVKKGDKVQTKQNLGRIFTDPSGKAVIKFFIYQNTNALNPELWLSRYVQ